MTEPARRRSSLGSWTPSLPFYPLALAVGFVLLVTSAAGVSPFAAVRTLGLTMIVAIAVTWVGVRLLGDPHRGGIVATLVILGILAGGDLRLAVVVAAAVVILAIERHVLPPARQTIRWPKVGMAASRLVAIFLLAIGIQAIQLGTFGLVARAVVMETGLQPGPQPVSNPSDPDIYLVLLDGHPRLDVGEELFGIDPAPLRTALQERGFAISERSRSNYTLTAQTLSSMFDQAHLPDNPRTSALVNGVDDRPAGAVVRGVINDNATFSMLRARGYEIEAIHSGFEDVALREADRFVDTGQLNEFEIWMMRRSIVGPLLTLAAPDWASAQHRDRINGGFDALASAPARATEHPTLMLAHIPSPHAPWVYNADGSPRTGSDLHAFYGETPATTGLTNEELGKAYAGQVVDTDRRCSRRSTGSTRPSTDRGRPAVVVVFSDHGTWIGADGGDMRLRFKTLLAVRSDGVQVSLDPDLTLVNLMPSLLAQLYEVPGELSADTTFFSGPDEPFDLLVVDDPDARSSPPRAGSSWPFARERWQRPIRSASHSVLAGCCRRRRYPTR